MSKPTFTFIAFRCTKGDARLIKQAAKKREKSVSEFIRYAIHTHMISLAKGEKR